MEAVEEDVEILESVAILVLILIQEIVPVVGLAAVVKLYLV